MRYDWILIADDLRDLAALGAPFRMMTTRDYVLQPKLLSGSRPKIINLARNYNYQTDGYYASLLGEARGHRVIPTVETLLDLYDREIPDDTASILEELGQVAEALLTHHQHRIGEAPEHLGTVQTPGDEQER